MNARGLEEAVADKGYHSGPMLKDWREIGVRSYLPEPQRGRRHWQGERGEQAAVYGNRRCLRGKEGPRLLLRWRGELLERTFAYVYDTGRMRRTHLPFDKLRAVSTSNRKPAEGRGDQNILKRLELVSKIPQRD